MKRQRRPGDIPAISLGNCKIGLRMQGFILVCLLFVALAVDSSQAGPLDTLQPGEWYEVPNSRLSAVLPSPIPPGGTGPTSIMIAWSGGAFDTKRSRLLVTGGGHNDYGGNEIYAFDLNTLTWSRIWGPSPNIPPTQGSCNEAYSDGNPASRHTYDGLEYLPNVDQFWVHGGSLYCAGGNAGMGTWTFDLNASRWTRRANGYQVGELEEVSAYDPVTGHVFAAGPASGQVLSEFDPVNNVWSRRSSSAITYGQTAVIDPVRRRFISLGSGSPIYSFDLNSSGLTRQTITTSGDQSIVGARYPGIAYDPVSDRIVGWKGGANVYALNLDTRVWTQVGPAATNTVIPTNPPSQGTFGRWQYVPSLNVFVIVNSIDQNVYIYRLSSGSATATPPVAPSNLRAE
jgi:hypothetical protein